MDEEETSVPLTLKPQSEARLRRASLVSLPVASIDDATLVQGLVERRPAAAAQLFDRYEPMVRGMLVRLLGSRDLDDLVQDTFLIVIRRCSGLRDPTALRAFVVSVVIRTARAELRKRRAWRWVGLGEVPEPPLANPHDATAAEGIRRVYEILNEIDADSRVAFLLRRVEGYELTETAEACGCSLATIKRRLARVERRFESFARRYPVLRAFLDGGDV